MRPLVFDLGRHMAAPVRRPSWWILAAIFAGCFLGSAIATLAVDFAWMNVR